MQGYTVEQLYARHAPAIEAHCSQLLGYRADASDAVHETFVRVMTRSREPDSPDHVVRSLFRISTNVCIDLLRQRGVRRRAAPALAAHVASEGGGQEAYDARESLERVLGRCDDTTRSIVAMRFIEGMPRTEIATALGTTRRTVFNRLKRLERLAGELVAGG